GHGSWPARFQVKWGVAMIATISLNVKPCPTSGDGVHDWVFHAACRAVEAGLTDEQADPIIEAMMTRYPSPATEVGDALNSARGTRSRSSLRWPQINEEQIEAIAQAQYAMRVWD